MKKRAAIALIAMLAVFGAAGCGTGSSGSGPAGQNADAGQAIRTGALKFKNTKNPKLKQCCFSNWKNHI